jgi:hypothetical protein
MTTLVAIATIAVVFDIGVLLAHVKHLSLGLLECLPVALLLSFTRRHKQPFLGVAPECCLPRG